jgi:hypothetical protein
MPHLQVVVIIGITDFKVVNFHGNVLLQLSCCVIPTKSGWSGRLITAKGTALGISLTGIVFPRPPGHKWPNFKHKKTALGTGSGFARLLELSSSVKKSIIRLGVLCQGMVLNSCPNQQVNLTAYPFAWFWFIGTNWHCAILNVVPSIRRPSYLFR